MRRPLSVERARAQPSRLLLEDYAVVPFTGRDAELSDLATWLGTFGQVRVRLIHGAGGQGKTRLANQLAAAATGADWIAWRVYQQPRGSNTRLPLPADGRGLLVLVDHADRWSATDLLALLHDLSSVATRTGAPVRVLLLARSHGFWWSAVQHRLDSDLNIDADQLRLDPLDSAAERTALFTSARNAFAQALAVDGAGAIQPPADLSDPEFAQILSIEMSALAAVEAHLRGTQAPESLPMISEQLLRRERAQWVALSTGTGPRRPTAPAILARVVCLATLIGPTELREAGTAMTISGIANSGLEALEALDDHRLLYPPSDARTVLEPLHPDRLGEDLLALATPGHPFDQEFTDPWMAELAGHLVRLADADATPSRSAAAVATLARTAERWPHVGTQLLFPFLRKRPEVAVHAGGAVLARLAALPDIDLALLETIQDRMPDQRHVDLDIAGAAVAMRVANKRLRSTSDPAERGQLITKLVERLANAGLRDVALPYAQEAVDEYRRLAAHRPDVWRFRLAGALNTLGALWSQLGSREAALPAVQEAVDIYRTVLQPDDSRVLAELAAALNNLGALWGRLNHREQALAATREAVEIHRRLAGAEPSVGLRDLAGSLNNLGAMLTQLGRYDEAIPASYEAVAYYRRLAEEKPSVLLPYLAGSLNNLSALTANVGKVAEALALANESVEIHRRLVEVNPTAWLPGLGASLNNRSALLARMSQHDAAHVAIQEAVEIYRRLAATNPSAWLLSLGGALNNLSVLQLHLGRYEEAVQAGQDSVDTRRRVLGVDHPDTLTSMNNLALAMQRRGGTAEIEFYSADVPKREISFRAGPSTVIAAAHTLEAVEPNETLRVRFAGDSHWQPGTLLYVHAGLDIAVIGTRTPQHEEEPTAPENRAVDVLSALASAVQQRYEESGSSLDLDRAVELYRQAVSLTDQADPLLWSRQAALASAMQMRFERSGASSDLDEAVELLLAAVNAAPSSSTERPAMLSNLAAALRSRYDRSGESEDLDQAIALWRNAVYRAVPAWPGRPSVLSNLAAALRTRYEDSGDADDLQQAVDLLWEAVSTTLPGQPERASMLSNLAIALRTKFQVDRNVRDLDEAIHLLRRAIATAQPAQPERASMLSNLAMTLLTRFEVSKDPEDLWGAVRALREAVSTAPPNQPERPSMLSSLAFVLQMRSVQTGDVSDLDEALRLMGQAVDSVPAGHPQRARFEADLARMADLRGGRTGSLT
jgi:tetratricopeptide (TPR) repeat protein